MFNIEKSQKASFPAQPDELFLIVQEVLNQLKWKTKRVDQPLRQIIARVGMSLFSWGENILIKVDKLDDENSVVIISSETTYQLIDWGKNRKNIEKFFSTIDYKIKR